MTYKSKVFEPNEKTMDHGSIRIELTNDEGGIKYAIETPYSYMKCDILELKNILIKLSTAVEEAIKANA